ncbi:CBS domain-containing protein [Gammaproteobacteria bacterium]
MTAPNSLITAIIDQLNRYAPFDQMAPHHLVWLVERLKVSYYAKGEVVLVPHSKPVDKFFIIKQGIILGEQEVVNAQEDIHWLELHDGECFPLGALLSNRAVTSTYRSNSDTFCFELTSDDFHELIHLSSQFQDFCTRRIANLLEQSKHVIQARYVKSSSDQQSLSSPLSAIVKHKPIFCSPATPLREVLEIMNKNGIGSMIAVDETEKSVGIFTLQDMLSRVTLPGLDLNEPLSRVMTRDPYVMSPHSFVYEAAAVMAKHGFRHILVEENGRLKGLISEKDLFSLQRISLRQISCAIRSAEDLNHLAGSAHDIRQLAQNMMAQGVAAEQLTQIISILNDLLTQRIITLELRNHPAVMEVEFCWLAMGSEGRFEQTLNTDQDNDIIFAVNHGQNTEDIRARLLPFAKQVNQALAECGIPLCGGEVMACNPKWCLSLEEWQKTFESWFYCPNPQSLLHATIFFDFRPLFGAEHLAVKLRDWLRAAAPQNPLFLRQMAENALRNQPPLGLVRDFVTGQGHTLDLKVNGITPFVDSTRIYSLAKGGAQTNTTQRLRELIEMRHITKQDADAWIESFLFIQLLRLRLHHEQYEQGFALTNKVDPDTLNNLDRRILKETFRQARKLQTKLRLDYQLS